MRTQDAGRPSKVRAAQILLIANAVIWLSFGIASFIRLAEQGAGPVTLTVVAALMFANAAAMLLCAVGLGTRRRIFYWLALAVLIVNIVLTFTDQFGVFDLITLAIDLVIVGLLISARGWFSRSATQPLSGDHQLSDSTE